MNKSQVLPNLSVEIGLVPVLRADSVSPRPPAIAGAIADGGVTVLEITMTVPGAIEVIRKPLAEQRPEEPAIGWHRPRPRDRPHVHPRRSSVRRQPRAQPRDHRGCATATPSQCYQARSPPTEIVTAWQAGADVVKVFPPQAPWAEQNTSPPSKDLFPRST